MFIPFRVSLYTNNLGQAAPLCNSYFEKEVPKIQDRGFTARPTCPSIGHQPWKE
jgi:hypothetical protein